MADSIVGRFPASQPYQAQPSIFTGSFWIRSVSMIALAASVHSERQALKRMTARDLKDIGMTEAEAAMEANRPIWDLPSERL